MSNFAEDYIDVAERIRLFIEKYPEGSLQAEIVAMTETRVVMKAYAYRTADDQTPGVGFAWEEVPGKTPYTRGSELMNCETSAWGRAIAALGIGTKKIATKDEIAAAKARLPESKWEVVAGPAIDGFPNAQADDSPVCVHGAMKHKSGEKNGKAWSAWFCPAPKDEACAPIWER